MARRRWKNLWALGGPFFVALFIWGLVLGGVLSSAPFPMPGASTQEVARYYGANRTAVLAAGTLQILSSLALLVFVVPVVALVRRVARERDPLPTLASGGGSLAAVLLLASALLGFALALTSGGSELGTVDALRQMNFLTGGTLHVASLGLFVGATSIPARGTKALPRWISRLGILASVLAILSLASLVWFPATFLIPLGRLLSFVWCIAVGIVLAFDGGRVSGTGG